MSIYSDEGHKSRRDHLKGLAEEFNLNIEEVFIAADMLGPDEDFDGLISTLEDMSMEK